MNKLIYILCVKGVMNTITIKLKKDTHLALKIWAAKNKTTFDGAIKQFLNENGTE